MNPPPPVVDDDDDDVSIKPAASVSSSSSSSMHSDGISLQSLLSSHSDGTTDIAIKREKLTHYARLLGISEDSLREHIDDSKANDQDEDGEQKVTTTTSKSTSSMPSSSTGDESINMSYSSSSRSSSTDADGSFGIVSSADSTCATSSSHQQQQRTVTRRPSCVSSICSGSILESIPEEDDMSCNENEQEGGDIKDESPNGDSQSTASSNPPLPSTITTTTTPSTATTRMSRRSSVGKPPLIPPTSTTSNTIAPDAPANGDEEEFMYDDEDDDDEEEEALSGVSLLIEDLYPDAFDSTPSRTASRDDDSTNGSVDARSVGTAETDGDVSTKSKPDPPESPVEAAKLRCQGVSPDSMHIDAALEVTPVIGNRARKGSTESIHIDDMFFDNDLHVLTSSESGNRERKGSLESMEVIIPDDFESAASNLSSCGVSDYQKYHHALLTQFLASPDLMGGPTPTSSSSDELGDQTTSNVILREQQQDTEGSQIAKMIVDLNKRLANIDSGLNADTSMAAETISELSTDATSSKKSTTSAAPSVLLNIVKDVKLELADVNMNFDAYRMKQRHLTEENELLARQKSHLEQQLDAITKDRDELRSELKMTLCIMSAEQKKLREAQIAQTQLKVELEATQSRLLEATKSEKKANLTMMNMMQHRRNSSDSEIFDFDPDVINKKVCDGDEGTIATQDVTNYESRRSIYSSSLSTIDSGSRRSIGSTSSSTPPSRGLFRRFSNMFNNSNEDMDAESTSSVTPSRQQHSRRHSDDGCVRRAADTCSSVCGDDEASRGESTTFCDQKKSDPRPRHMRRASIGGCNYTSMSTSSIIGQNEVKGTMPLSSEPRKSMKMFHASTRSINTHNVSIWLHISCS